MSKKTVILRNFKIYFLRLWSYDWGLQYSTRLLPQSLNISSYGGAIGESNIESFYLKEKDREFLIIVCYRRIKQNISSFCLPTEVGKTLGNPQ